MHDAVVGTSAMRQAAVWTLVLETVAKVHQAPNIPWRHPGSVIAVVSHETVSFKYSIHTRPGDAHIPYQAEPRGRLGLQCSPIGPSNQVGQLGNIRPQDVLVRRLVSRGVTRPFGDELPCRQDQGPCREAGELRNRQDEVGGTQIAAVGAGKRMGRPPVLLSATETTRVVSQQAEESPPITTPAQATALLSGGLAESARKRLFPRLLVGADAVLHGVDKR